MIDPFQETQGLWLKAALHVHTSASDGDLSPEAVVRHHEWAGFDVVAITDHWTLTGVRSTDRLLVLSGAELAVDPLAKGRFTEILAVGIHEIPEDPGGDREHWRPIDSYFFKTFPDLTTAAANITGQGGVAYVAHPYWSGLPPEVILETEGVTGIELFNASAERECGRGDSSYVWDLALEVGKHLFAIAADDSHYPGFDIGDAWTMVQADDRTPDAVIAALREGRSYASAGPTLHYVHRDGNDVEVHCTSCRSIVLASRHELGWAVRADARGRQEHARILERDDSGLIVRARFSPPIDDLSYVRIVVTDPHGRSAWTNPI